MRPLRNAASRKLLVLSFLAIIHRPATSTSPSTSPIPRPFRGFTIPSPAKYYNRPE